MYWDVWHGKVQDFLALLNNEAAVLVSGQVSSRNQCFPAVVWRSSFCTQTQTSLPPSYSSLTASALHSRLLSRSTTAYLAWKPDRKLWCDFHSRYYVKVIHSCDTQPLFMCSTSSVLDELLTTEEEKVAASLETSMDAAIVAFLH